MPKNRQAQKDEMARRRRERALRGDIPKRTINIEDINPRALAVPGVAPSGRNKPKWKDRSGYRTK